MSFTLIPIVWYLVRLELLSRSLLSNDVMYHGVQMLINCINSGLWYTARFEEFHDVWVWLRVPSDTCSRDIAPQSISHTYNIPYSTKHNYTSPKPESHLKFILRPLQITLYLWRKKGQRNCHKRKGSAIWSSHYSGIQEKLFSKILLFLNFTGNSTKECGMIRCLPF